MALYYGDDRARRIQRAGDDLMDWAVGTPGACPTGRAMATDDPDRLGWEEVDRLLEANGAVAFRLLPRGRLPELDARYGPRGCRIDIWNILTGTAEEVLRATAPLLAAGLPTDLRRVEVPADPEAPLVTAMQDFLQRAEMMPFSGRMLTGAFGRVANVVLTDADGAVAAMAHAYFPHNASSPHRLWAWGGLAAVAPARRGTGLGKLVNAMMAREAVSVMGASHLYELVGPTNTASRRMVEGAGLALSEELVTAVVQPEGAARITR